MAKTSNMYIRIDPEIKTEVETIYKHFGMSLTDAINLFIYKSRNVGGLPFDLRIDELQINNGHKNQSSILNLRGKYRGVITSEDFMAEKQYEKVLEA